MSNNYKAIIITVMMILGLNTMSVSLNAAEQQKDKPNLQTPVKSANVEVISGLRPVDVVNKPSEYLNKNITFTSKFVAFSSLGLDYPKAMRSSEDYIGFLIMRDDVNNVIPLSEFKLFMKRKMAEKYVDLEQGDTVKIEANIFSTALGDPWGDIVSMSVISKVNPKSETDKK
ncbi:hypothetical protein IKQ26_02485 [bacterium]|nr:hypothetical protein [bacterium]